MTGFHEHKDSHGQPGWEKCKHVEYLPMGQGNVQVINLNL